MCLRDVLAERGVDLGVALVVVEPGDGGGVIAHGGEGGVDGRGREQLGPRDGAEVGGHLLVELALQVAHSVL